MKKILIVDDDSRMLKLLKSYLEEGGIYETVPIKSGAAALVYLQENIPDAIILDYMMPAIDGPHTLEQIRKTPMTKNIPVIFLTSVTEKNKVQECMQFEPDGYLLKPVAQEELLMTLGQIFTNRAGV